MESNQHPEFPGLEELKKKQHSQLAEFIMWKDQGNWNMSSKPLRLVDVSH